MAARRGGSSSVNVIVLVLVTVLAGGAYQWIGRTPTGVILSSGLAAYGVYLVWRGQRTIGALFLVAAGAIAVALIV